MHFYETTYILHPALQEGRLKDIISSIENKAKSLDAHVLHTDNWGRKKLAYLIDKEKYGTYIFLQYKLSESSNLKELSSEFEHNPNVLRYLNIKIDKEDVFETSKKEDDSNPINNVKESTSDNLDKGKESKNNDDKDSNLEEEK